MAKTKTVKTKTVKTIYVLDGPNLNSLGSREPEKYGHSTLAEVETLCRATAKRFGLDVDFRQSNHEGDIVDAFHEAKKTAAVGVEGYALAIAGLASLIGVKAQA